MLLNFIPYAIPEIWLVAYNQKFKMTAAAILNTGSSNGMVMV